MSRPRLAPSLIPVLLALAAAPLACQDDEEDKGLGAPCDSAEDCSGDLICDVHGELGTCQPDHGHREAAALAEIDDPPLASDAPPDLPR